MDCKFRNVAEATFDHYSAGWRSQYGTEWLDRSSIDEVTFTFESACQSWPEFRNVSHKNSHIDMICEGFKHAVTKRWGRVFAFPA